MSNYLFFGLVMATVFIAIRYLPQLSRVVFSKKQGHSFSLDKIEIIVEWIFYFIVFTSFIGSVSHYGNHGVRIVYIVLGIFFAALLISFNFIVYPFLMLLRKKKYKSSPHYEKLIHLFFKDRIQVKILNENITNAYATGVVPQMRFILLGRTLLERMNEEEVKHLLFHEYAHIKYKHILILFSTNLIVCILWVTSA